MIEFIKGDITQETTEAIVNAANSHLAGGGGVDGAIHRAGGPAIMKELKEKYKACPTGSAVITRGGNLKARNVIHAVGPFYLGIPGVGNGPASPAGGRERFLLASAYQKSLELCSEHKIKTVSFPSISTGAYHYPLDKAAPIAVKTVRDYLANHSEIKLVRFVLFDDRTFQAYQSTFAAL
jgi:O-acetyl-ADP-ribose deacetylase (regulator of RNase III)